MIFTDSQISAVHTAVGKSVKIIIIIISLQKAKFIDVPAVCIITQSFNSK